MVRKRKRTWSDDDLISAVAESYCLADVLVKLNLVKGGSYKTIKFHIERLDVNISHFLSKGDLLKRARSAIKVKSNNELFIENGSYNDYKRVKELIIKQNILPYECAICKISSWNGTKLTLQMDHINVNKRDNRLDNLRLLCPNCHSLTDNFCGKNTKKSKIKNETITINNCISCGKQIHRTSTWCKSCKIINSSTKIIWPNLKDLFETVQKFGYSETGRQLGVSDNAVRKRLKKLMDSSPNGMAPDS